MSRLSVIQSPQEAGRPRRHSRPRKRLIGTAERPRLAVHRSHLHFYASAVNDMTGQTLMTLGTTTPEFRKTAKKGGNVEGAVTLGALFAQAAKAKGITKIGRASGRER